MTREHNDRLPWTGPADPRAAYHRGRAEAFREAAALLNSHEPREAFDVWKRLLALQSEAWKEAGR